MDILLLLCFHFVMCAGAHTKDLCTHGNNWINSSFFTLFNFSSASSLTRICYHHLGIKMCVTDTNPLIQFSSNFLVHSLCVGFTILVIVRSTFDTLFSTHSPKIHFFLFLLLLQKIVCFTFSFPFLLLSLSTCPPCP